jgi:N-acetylglucosamine kinase-like BadF-type ATPase
VWPLLGNGRFACGNDMICGWAGSLGCEDGINIVAGTGSIGYGERQGESARVGGWGEAFGDEGSAHWIAIQGLALFSRMSDGRMARGPLYDRVVEAFSLRKWSLRWRTRQDSNL